MTHFSLSNGTSLAHRFDAEETSAELVPLGRPLFFFRMSDTKHDEMPFSNLALALSMKCPSQTWPWLYQ